MKHTKMKHLRLLSAASLLLLAGCLDSGQKSNETDNLTIEQRKAQSLNTAETFYSFPSNGQRDIAVNSNIILSFSHPLQNIDNVELTLNDSMGVKVPVTVFALSENPNGLSLKPTSALTPNATYTLDYNAPLIKTVSTATGNSESIRAINKISFTTRIGSDSNEFVLDENGIFPTADLPFTTFTTLRFRFNNEIDINTMVLGNTFSFNKVGSVEQVPGELIIKGRYVTFDPSNDLESNESYELVMTEGIKDVWGKSLSPFKRTMVAQDVGVRSFSTMNVTKNSGNELSMYSGQLTNAVTIQSSLIGSKDTTYVDADLVTELANPGRFAGASPLTIRKGTVMNASSLDVKVGGQFPTGFSTGNIRMTTISDATGYLIDNANSSHKYAPKQLRLLMDVAMTTDGYLENGVINGKANGGLSQDVMHLDVLGTVRAEGTRLIIDAVGEIDLKILGLESANAQVSFHMESYKADEAPNIPIDTEAATLQSAYPGLKQAHFSLSDNIIFNFNEPLARSSLNTVLLLDANSNTVPIIINQDGASIVIDPVEDLQQASTYKVTGTLSDIAGNLTELNESFSTPYRKQENRMTAPLVMGMVPGYACAMEDEDYGNDIAGKCSGAEDNEYFNVFDLQADREIFIAFNQRMDEASFVLGETCDTGTFRVEIVNAAGDCIETVPGNMTYADRVLTFKPKLMWSAQGDNLYRYMLKTALNKSKNDVNCRDGSIVCSENGYPLQTTLLRDDSAEDQGGPDMRVPFRAAPADSLVFAPLMMPTTDSNYDHHWDAVNESVFEGNYASLAVTSWSGLIVDAAVGCKIGAPCTEDQSKTFINGFMPTEIGEYDPIYDRIPVKVHAQQLISSEVFVQTKLLVLPVDVPTATMTMRPIYPKVNGKTTVPEGYIFWNAEEGRLNFKIDLEVYMDSPFMKIPLNLPHNLHSYKITMNLQGPVEFLPDGRMNISLRNQNAIDLNVEIGSTSKMTLTLAKNAVSLQHISRRMK